VLRDIVDPNYSINPDFITHQVHLKDGRSLTGTVRTEGKLLHISDSAAKVVTVRADQVEEMSAVAGSIMPDNLAKQLGPEKMKDLLTYLLTDPPHMPEYGKETPPPPRSSKEVKDILAGAPEPPEKIRPIQVVLVSGRKDHGLGEHDYPAWQQTWQKLLALAEDTKVSVADDWPTADALRTADVLVFYQQGKWTAERAKDIDAFLERGGGLVYIHYAVDGGSDAPGFAQRIGLAWSGGKSKFRHGALEVGLETGGKHPIARNFNKVQFHDESYWNLVGDPKKITLLGSGTEEDQQQPLFWTLEPSKGRVFVSIPGHFAWTFDDPLFRMLLLRGIAWTAREPVDRFNDIVTAGARVKP
jgi:type 1 glutamine amidotransferase